MMMLTDKTVILRQGDVCHHVFLITKGRVKRSRTNARGDQFTIAVLTEGQLFGSMLADPIATTVSDTAEAKGRTILFRVRLKEFRELVISQGQLAREIVETLSKEQRTLERKLELMIFHDVRSRIAETLRDLAGSHSGPCRHGFQLDIKLTQQEFADLVGATRPVVSTILNEFKSRGILDYHRTLICIQNLDGLD